ncbi:hypothetical protein VTO42DRAFT_8328 [Malbranchea cinnamomea]
MESDNAAPQMKRALSSQYPQSEHSSTRQQSPHNPGHHDHPPQKHTVHKAHRQHLVGAHRGRNLSHKSLNKLQRLALTHNLATEGGEQHSTSTIHRHQRKKSAPVSPSTSPRTGAHARWNGSVVGLGGHGANTSMKKNLSTPALRRNVSSTLVKKGHPPNKPLTSAKPQQKKTVGFELADSDEDDEWEDHSSLSASSTRRNSLATPSKMNGDTVTKSPLAQETKAPEPPQPPEKSQATAERSQPPKPLGQEYIASRLLNRPRASKAPPTLSSVSVTAKPAVPDRMPQNSSLGNLSSSFTTANNNPSFASNPHGTSSSAEGRVSRFLTNDPNNPHAQSASNPSTPSSFLPHYHPNTPPSPDVVGRRPKSPTSRRRFVEPASRTQQKLWLQRTATLSTSPPEPSMGGLRSTIGPSAVHPSYGQDNLPTGSRVYVPDSRRGVMVPGLPGGAGAGSEAQRTRKIYDRLTSELSVVQRFRNPITDSLTRLLELLGPDCQESSTRGRFSRPRTNGQPGPVTSHSQPRSRAVSATREADSGPNSQFLTNAGSEARIHDQYHVNVNGPGQQRDENHNTNPEQLEQQQTPPIPLAVGLPNGHDEGQSDDPSIPRSVTNCANGLETAHTDYHASEEEMLLRRMWESREVAIGGD